MHNFFRNIKDRLSGISKLDREISAIEAKFAQMVAETAQTENTTAEDGVSYSISKPFSKQVDEVLDNKFDRTNAVYVGKTPEILQKVGLNGDFPMLTTARHIRDANKPKDTKKHHHGLSETQIKHIPNQLANPVMIMDSLNEKSNSVVVVTDMLDTDKSPIIISVKTDGKGMYNNVEIDSNFLTGFYGRDGFANFVENNVAKNNILYINKEKAIYLSTESSSSWLEQLKNYDFDVIIRKTRANVNANLKQKQFEIIEATNPMWDEYHLGIRSADDIRTWEEVLELDDESEGQFVWGDFTRQDAEKASQENSITVYSSYPIKNGTFVSTSRIQAREYAGGKSDSKVYSKTVPLGDVAWINGDEGQFAKVETNTEQGENYSFSVPDGSYTAEEMFKRFENGEITRDEYMESIRKPKILNPKEIADLTEQDADITSVDFKDKANRILDREREKAIQNGATPQEAERIAQEQLQKIEGRIENNPNAKQSKFYASALASNIVTQEMKDEIAADTFIRNYGSTTNKRTLNMAMQELEEGGAERVVRWRELAPERASAVDVAIGFILLENYQRAGNTAEGLAIAEKLRQIGTASGQAVQMFSILGRFSPDIMVAYAQKELDKAFEILVEKKSKKWADANRDRFNLTDEEIEIIRRKTLAASKLEDGSRTKAILLGEIAALIQDKLPSKPGDNVRALQRISLLLNLRTNVRNIAGNAGMVPMFIASDFFGSIIDKQIAKKTNVRTTGNAKLSGKEFGTGFYESYDDLKRGIRTKQEELDRFDNSIGQGKAFNEHHNGKLAKQLNAISKALNKMDDFTSFLLEAGDRTFYQMWFMNSLNNQLRLNNTKIPTADMINIAREEALQRTWQDNNAFTRTVSKWKQGFNLINIKGYGLGDFILKFTKTPANIAKAMVEFSPVGLPLAIKKGLDLKLSMENGTFTPTKQKAFVDSVGRAITGTITYIIIAALASAGLLDLTGSGDDDKDAQNFEKYVAGVSPYSINLFGQNITYDWFQPFGTTLAVVAEIMENQKEDEDSDLFNDAVEVFKSASAVFTQQSFLRGLYEFFAAEDLGTGLASAALSEPAAFMPQILSQLASMLDPNMRETYEGKGKEIQTAINRVIAKIPGLRQTLPQKVNVLGKDAENVQYMNPWEAFANPSTTYPKSSGKVANEIYSLYKQSGEASVMPRVAPYSVTKGNATKQFSAQERADFQKRMGTLNNDILETLFNSDEYTELTESEKISVIEDIYQYSYNKAISELDIFDYETIKNMLGDGVKLSQDKWNSFSPQAKQRLIDEEIFSKSVLRCKDNPEALIKLFIKQAKD